jgi:DNA-binding winged helix-turn-helix (wHTH) protein
VSLQESNSPDVVGAARPQVSDFGPVRLDSGKRLLLRSGYEVHLAPKAFDTLLLLIENRGRVLTKGELIKSLWPDTFVEEINLGVHISALRKALGEEPGSHRYIVTSPRRGYAFAADVRETSAGKIGGQQKAGELCAGTGAGSGNDPRLRRTSLREPMVLPAWVLRRRNRIRDLAILATILIALVGWLAIRRPGRKTQRGYESIRNPGAHEAYLRGLTFWNKRTGRG